MPQTAVVLMTAFGTPEVAEGALRLGAYRVVSKPFDMHEIETLTREAYQALPRLPVHPLALNQQHLAAPAAELQREPLAFLSIGIKTSLIIGSYRRMLMFIQTENAWPKQS